MDYTLSVAEAAREMGVGPKFVLNLIEAGAIPAVKFGSGYRLRKADVTKYIDLHIAIQTTRRLEQTKLKAKNETGQPGTPTPVHEPAIHTKRGRKRNPIPTIPAC